MNTRGEPIEAWATVAVIDAAIRPLSGREGLATQQIYASATHEIEMRYRAGVVPKMRFRKDARVFDIDFVRNVEERNRQMFCVCTERNL